MKKLAIFLFIGLLGCNSNEKKEVASNEIDKTSEISKKEHAQLAVLWQQLSSEYRALCYQSFRFARIRLENELKVNQADKPLAIVTDIDETVLDNSPYSAKLILDDEEYSRDSWADWGRRESAEPLPGSLDFFRYADSCGVDIFYISNRRNSQKPETIRNLQASGFPVDTSKVLLRTDVSGKEPRRKVVEESHEIIMLLGDNLSDFHMVFDDKHTGDRNRVTDSLRNHFGDRYIVFPNPMYGDWETDGLYEGNFSLTPEQKDSVRRSKLRAY